ncbi:MAG: fumarate hydratase [Clostridiales bacterium]|nr:fumarate hydratase [Clostridiales bacterium]MDD7034633.1 fumarate hydratase [Bacillota bacterium]MDY2919738.1 fumarate hydratase [Lentihominibacter sp.]
MKILNVKEIENAVRKLCTDTNYILGNDVRECIHSCRLRETWPVAEDVLASIEENIEIAAEGEYPLCQDTGMACVFLEIGQGVVIEGGSAEDAVNRGVRAAYEEAYLRKSIVADPLRRVNTGDNTPAAIYWELVPGNNVKITVAPKGFGSENMSRIAMLPPSAGEEGVKDFVVETSRKAGANPCPPIVVGVGIGGNFDKAALMAKKALLRPLDRSSEDEYYRDMEEELLERINSLGIGPQGFGGRTTALKVNVLAAPTHIAGLPVAVNINCHVCRHGEVIL